MPVAQSTSRTKPPALRAGDTIGIVAPASNIQRDLLITGCGVLRRLGYLPVYSDSIFDCDLYFAGTLERRLRELEEMFVRDDVRAIICARGGYGSNYLLGRLDPSKIATHPKIFVGYSDITSLLTCFCDSARFVTFHGPMVTKDFAHEDGVDLPSWQSAMSGAANYELVADDSGVSSLYAGSSPGILYGGCLSILVASLGTPHEIHTDGTILFLEDVNAKPFQIDRMLMQLREAGKLNAVKGIVFGEMLDCMQSPTQDYTLQEVVRRAIGDLGIPIAWGLRSGHVTRRNVTLPLGVRAALEVTSSEVSLRVLEPATENASSEASSRDGRESTPAETGQENRS
jgi:muramoyltetrapeptide carboxypeptidase